MAVIMGINTNIKQVTRDLDRTIRKQIPFATAVALTRLAQQSQVATKTALHMNFELRNPRRLEAGIRIKPARKQDFRRGDIHSEVFDIDPFMELQEEGGIKRSGSRMLAIPGELVHETKRTSTGAIKKPWKPRALYAKKRMPGRPRKWGRHKRPRPFIMHYGGGGSIAIRTGPERYPIEYLYHFSSKAVVPARFRFIHTVDEWVSRNYDKEFLLQLRRAIK